MVGLKPQRRMLQVICYQLSTLIIIGGFMASEGLSTRSDRWGFTERFYVRFVFAALAFAFAFYAYKEPPLVP